MINRRRSMFDSPRPSLAFTMIELIVVSVLLVIFAAVIVPRVMQHDSRRARVVAEAVRDLLTAAGEREAMTSQAVTVAFDSEPVGGGRISMLSTSATGKTLVPDLLVQPVPLNGLELERCTAGGQTLSRQRWRIPLREGEVRPAIGLVLRQAGGERWLVSLSSEAVSATLVAITPGDVPDAGSGSIDLDQNSRKGEAW